MSICYFCKCHKIMAYTVYHNLNSSFLFFIADLFQKSDEPLLFSNQGNKTIGQNLMFPHLALARLWETLKQTCYSLLEPLLSRSITFLVIRITILHTSSLDICSFFKKLPLILLFFP